MHPIVVAICQRLPCEIRAYPLPHHSGTPTFELLLPFIFTNLIIALTVVTTNEVKIRAESHLTADWTEQDLEQVDADRSPRTHAQAFPWVADAAQIPAIIGTPLVGLLVLRPDYQLGFIFAYIVAIGLGIMLFVHFLRKVDIYRYKDKGRHWFGYQISPLALGGFAWNIFAILMVLFVVK
jgi:hypothetical protein